MMLLMRGVERVLARAKSSSDVVLAAVMAMIIAAMIVPLPAWLLDTGIAINLAAALSLLVAALYAKDALKVATFPTLLLLTTLFRLAMNVSSTRLALSEGHAGEIIQAFGDFVVRGDYVVGAVIFSILTLVQFLVVAKGAERVAEVSARFTLDAMPGKQMSIDADLRAGAITQEQARARRRDLERESQLFGSMDGAMKFVKGDVIAGLVITLINLGGGILIGVLQNGMTAAEAAQTYALIAIGDGLVSQIPSLCIAVAAGIVVTRVNSEKDDHSLGGDIGAQFFGQHQALFVVSGLCVALSTMPGMPHFTFLVIAACAALAGLGLRRMRNAAQAEQSTSSSGHAPAPESGASPANAASSSQKEYCLAVTPLMFDLAPDLSWLAQEAAQRFVFGDLEQVRERLFLELGIRIPGFRVRVGAPLPARSWALSVDEVPSGRGELPEGELFALASEADLARAQVASVALSHTDGPLCAVAESDRPKLEQLGVALRTPSEWVAEQVLGHLRRRAPHFLGVQEVQTALAGLELQAPALVKEALQKIPLPLFTDVLRRLLQERVSIRNLRAILEALVAPSAEGDAGALAERCRSALARQISFQYAGGGPLYAFLVDPAVEETLRQAGPTASLEPSQAGAILEGVKRVAKQGRAVLLSSPDVRRILRRLLEGAFPEVAVLTFGELDPELHIRPVGRLTAATAR